MFSIYIAVAVILEFSCAIYVFIQLRPEYHGYTQERVAG